MVSFDQAIQSILEAITPVQDEACALRSIHGRVLAEDVIALMDVPPFDNSAMDGFALRSEDTAGARLGHPLSLNVSAEVSAGESSAKSLRKGSAFRILTGAPIPAGANAVIEQEQVKLENGRVSLEAPVSSGRNIRLRGEDVTRGTCVFSRGMILHAARVGVVASLGIESLRVYKTPRVAVLPTGNELVEVGKPLSDGKIHDSNSYTLQGLVRETACEPIPISPASDSMDDLKEKLRLGLAADALITAGGVSVGTRDLVLQVLRELGVEVLFWKVNIKPGMPFAFGLHRPHGVSRTVPVFALPGNPVSAMVTFLQFVRPALQKMMGISTQSEGVTLRATLEHDYEKTDGKLHFARGVLRNENGKLIVRTTGSQSSGVLTSLSSANCLIIIRESESLVRAGSEVEVQLIREVEK